MLGVFKHEPAQPFLKFFFFFGKAGGKGSRRRGRRPVLTIAESYRGRAPSESATVRMPCDLWKVNKGWSTAGLPENREQTRSNTLLLGAAEETELSQPACESTVDFSPWNVSRQRGGIFPISVFIVSEVTPIFSAHFSLHTWLDTNPWTPAFWFFHNKYHTVSAEQTHNPSPVCQRATAQRGALQI